MELRDTVGQTLGVGVRCDQAIHPVAYCVLACRGAERDHRKTTGHCVEKGSPEICGEMGHEKNMRARKGFAKLGTWLHGTGKLDAFGDAQFLRQELERL